MPARPPNVPATAEFFEAYKVWGEGATDANAKRQGPWKWWSPDDGRLVAIEHYDAGIPATIESFYPDGKLFGVTVMKQRVAEQQRFFIDRSQDWKPLLKRNVTMRVDDVPDWAMEVRKVPNKYPLSYEFFDADGRKLNRLGMLPEAAEDLANAALAGRVEGETASAAVDRYVRFCDQLVDATGTPKDPLARWRLRFAKPIDPSEIGAAEERLGAKLPPSYVSFVTRRGPFSGPGEYLRMLGPRELANLRDRPLKSQIEALKTLVVFSTGQYEGLLDCFQLGAADPATGEAPILTLDPEAGEGKDALQQVQHAAGDRTFDRHVRALVDFNIREVARWLRPPTY